jgi:hypothetical protein
MKAIHVSVVTALVTAALCSSMRAEDAPHTMPGALMYLDQTGWGRASGEEKSAFAADFMRVFCGNPAMPPADLVGCLDRSGNAGSIFARAMACAATVPVRP